MTPQPIHRYLGVAIDHGASFDNWLSEWGADPKSRVSTKHGIISVCLRAGISGLVVGTDFNSGLEAVVKAAGASDTETWLGLPDMTIHGQYDTARSVEPTYPPGAALYLAKDADATGVKFSIGLAARARWGDAMHWLRPWLTMAQELDLAVIVEPYFRVHDNVSERLNFLRDLKRFECVQFAKLDVHNPELWSHHYGGGFSPWLARSEGLEFPSYCERLEQSLTAGCAGTMVGAGVWGIKGLPLLGDKFTNELVRRLALLRNLVKPEERSTLADDS
jgi:hypothetical protein